MPGTIADLLDDTSELPLSDDLATACQAWLSHLAHSRDSADLTITAYERDLRQFLGFLKTRFGHAPTLNSLAKADAKMEVPLFLCSDTKVPLLGIASEELRFATEEPNKSLSRPGISVNHNRDGARAEVEQVPLFFNPEQLADLAQVTPRAVRKAISEGRLRVLVATADAGHHKGRAVHAITHADGFALYPKAKIAWETQKKLRAATAAVEAAAAAAPKIAPPQDPAAIPAMKDWQRKRMDARLGLLRFVESLTQELGICRERAVNVDLDR